jgi:hypothetical protein
VTRPLFPSSTVQSVVASSTSPAQPRHPYYGRTTDRPASPSQYSSPYYVHTSLSLRSHPYYGMCIIPNYQLNLLSQMKHSHMLTCPGQNRTIAKPLIIWRYTRIALHTAHQFPSMRPPLPPHLLSHSRTATLTAY